MPGDSLESIANKFEVDVETLIRRNDLSKNHILTQGQQLNIPVLILHRRSHNKESSKSIAQCYQIDDENVISSISKSNSHLKYHILLF